MGSVLPAIAVSPKPLTDACTKIFARQNTAPCIAEGKPVLLLEHGGKTEGSDLLSSYHVRPDIRFTTWEDFSIMAMVEKGMEISMLPDLILRRVPYKIEIRPLEEPYYRSVGLAMKKQKKPDSSRSKIYRISAVQGDGVNRLII
jgi:DNA-binding transcriptional LysR family regulator